MSRPFNREKGKTRTLVLHSATKLFIENGYTNTRIKDIAEEANVSYNDVFRLFGEKENILSELVGLVLEFQFEKSIEITKEYTDDKLFIYAFETVLQLYVAEGVEHIREMYLVSYSLPNASKVVYKTITSKLEDVFKGSLPELETKDFYELEIASAGIMRGYISVPCDMYFTMERKRKRFLETLLKIYDVPKEKVIDIIKFIEQFDFKKHADDLLKSLFNYLESKI